MNARSYKTVFSKRLGTLVAVGEHASSQGKANGAGSGGGAGASATLGYIAALTASFAFVSLAWAAPANNALPTGGTVVQGAASMAQTANQLNIQQTTQRAAINWQSFDIGSQARVQVYQPNAQSVLLNRVVGATPSQIFGQMQANGHVILVNPNGVLFGKDGSVNAGGFTASTLNITDANFMAGNMVYERNGSTAGIVNEGSITTAPGGYVALLGASVSNLGKIDTQGGNVFLGAADTIKVPVSSTGRIKLELTAADMNANVINTGSIITQGGQVYMQALALNQAAAQIIQSGSIDTTGEKGGEVHVLADGGHIRVDGRIKANSNNGTAGGDIYIGRDKDTNVLAAVGDVRGATLESQGGFIETSGSYLATNGVNIKAKDWLLDPADITISTGNDTDFTNNSGTYEPNSGSNTSVVKVDTIQTAINAGTSVTITTTNTGTSGSGSGNIIIANALAFANNSNTDATLNLIADNGITQNTGASITTNAVSGKTGLVNISMTAKGNYQGNTAASANSQGITLNAAIKTNGDVTLNGKTNNSGAASASNAIGVDIKSTAAITAKNISITGNSQSSFGIQSASVLNATDKVTLDGTSKNWVGVTTTGAITATNGLLSIKGTKGTATDASGYQGININSNLTGASVSLIGTSYGHYGVQVQNVTVKSTSGDVYIEGTGSNTAITTGQNESSGTRIAGIVDAKAKAIIKGTTSDAGLYQGLIISNEIKGASVEITGIAANHIGAAVNNGAKVTASTGDVIINGTSNTNEGLGIGSQGTNGGATITATEGSVSLTGTSNSSLIKSGTAGVRFWGKNSVIADKAINITGTVDTLVNKSGVGVEFQRYPSSTSLKTTKGDINITGTLTGVGGGSGVRMGESGWNAEAPMISAGGNFTLRGNNRASSSNASAAISALGGMQVRAGGNIVVQAETNNNAVAAMNFYSGYAGTWSNALQANTSFITTKDVLIQANQGGIVFYNNIPSNLTNGTLTALTDIQGKNITIDNTGAGMAIGAGLVVGSGGTKGGAIGSGIIDAATGAITTAGSGGANGGTSGVSIDGRKITATDNLNIMGVAKGTGTGIFSGAVIKGGTVDMTGTGGAGKGVYSFGAITSTVGGVSIKGTVTGSSGSIGTHIQGPVTAQTDINLEGYTAGTIQGLLIQQTAVTSTAGDITVKGENKLNDGRAVTLFDGLLKNVANGKTININANTLFMTGSSTVNAGSTGTVKIKTLTPGNEIKIGSSDMGGAALGSQILGIDNGELNRITAGNLVIGDTTSNGKITVAAATTTQSQTGNITLQTGGNISVDHALTVADTKNLTLQAKGDVTIGAEIKRTGAGNLVIAAGLGKAAEDGAGVGQVKKAISGGKITNAGGNTYIYTGEVASSAKMSDLNNAFNTLYLTTSGANAQNAQSNTATALANTISGGANTQVLYREKIAVNLSASGNSLTNAVKAYSDVSQSTVNSDAQTALKDINADKALSWSQSGNTFNLSSDKLIDTLSVDGAAFSTAQKLKASASAYGTTSSTYRVSSGSAMPTLKIDQKALTISGLAASDKIYNGDAVAAVVTTGVVKTGLVGADAVTVGATGKFRNDTNTADDKNVKLVGGVVAAKTVALSSSYGGADKDNYAIVDQTTSSATITPRPLTIATGTVADKPADGTTTATVTPGGLGNLVAGESLGVSATGNFSDANVGNGKVVTASYTLRDGANGLASNYILNASTPNPDSRLRGNILASVNPVINPTPTPVNNNTGSRVSTVSGFGGSGAATGVLDDKPVTESREVCSDVFPENCECQPSVIPSIEICFAPKRVAATKEEK